jgi:hypothetical protein
MKITWSEPHRAINQIIGLIFGTIIALGFALTVGLVLIVHFHNFLMLHPAGVIQTVIIVGIVILLKKLTNN